MDENIIAGIALNDICDDLHTISDILLNIAVNQPSNNANRTISESLLMLIINRIDKAEIVIRKLDLKTL